MASKGKPIHNQCTVISCSQSNPSRVEQQYLHVVTYPSIIICYVPAYMFKFATDGLQCFTTVYLSDQLIEICCVLGLLACCHNMFMVSCIQDGRRSAIHQTGSFSSIDESPIPRSVIQCADQDLHTCQQQIEGARC